MNSMKEIYDKIKEKEMNYVRYVNRKGHTRVKSLFEYQDNELKIFYQDNSEGVIRLDDKIFKFNENVKVNVKEEGSRILLEFIDRKGSFSCLFSFEK